MKMAGVVLRVGDEPRFLSASSVVRVASTPPVTAVPGGSPGLLGIALHEGSILPVLALGPERREMIVCQHEGELVGLVGVEVLRTGLFEVAPGGEGAVHHEGRPALPLDLSALCLALQGSRRAGHFAMVRGR